MATHHVNVDSGGDEFANEQLLCKRGRKTDRDCRQSRGNQANSWDLKHNWLKVFVADWPQVGRPIHRFDLMRNASWLAQNVPADSENLEVVIDGIQISEQTRAYFFEFLSDPEAELVLERGSFEYNMKLITETHNLGHITQNELLINAAINNFLHLLRLPEVQLLQNDQDLIRWIFLNTEDGSPIRQILVDQLVWVERIGTLKALRLTKVGMDALETIGTAVEQRENGIAAPKTGTLEDDCATYHKHSAGDVPSVGGDGNTVRQGTPSSEGTRSRRQRSDSSSASEYDGSPPAANSGLRRQEERPRRAVAPDSLPVHTEFSDEEPAIRKSTVPLGNKRRKVADFQETYIGETTTSNSSSIALSNIPCLGCAKKIVSIQGKMNNYKEPLKSFINEDALECRKSDVSCDGCKQRHLICRDVRGENVRDAVEKLLDACHEEPRDLEAVVNAVNSGRLIKLQQATSILTLA